MHGAKVCVSHGGASRRAVQLHAIRHGRYSKYLPEELRASYEEYLADPVPAKLDAEIALLRTHIGEYEGRLTAAGMRPSEDTLQVIAGLLDTLSRLVTRRVDNEHKEQYIATHGKVLTWIAQVSDVVKTAIETNVSNRAERARAIDAVRAGVARLGVITD